MLAAVVAGYEVGGRVGESVIPESYFFWHTTGTAGTLGAAASAAKVLGLDAAATLQCLGSAGTQAAGLWEFLKEGTDNQGWRNSTAEQSRQKNLNLSQERAQSVASYLLNCGVSSNQIKGVQGMGESDPIASNDTAAGREQNRRVEVYMYASEQMIKDAQAASN